MGYYLYLGKRAVVLASAVMSALSHSASDRLVGVAAAASFAAVLEFVHYKRPCLSDFLLSLISIHIGNANDIVFKTVRLYA